MEAVVLLNNNIFKIIASVYTYIYIYKAYNYLCYKNQTSLVQNPNKVNLLFIMYPRIFSFCNYLSKFIVNLFSYQVSGEVFSEEDRLQVPRDLQQFAFSKFSSVYFADGGQLSPRKQPITRPFLTKAAVR